MVNIINKLVCKKAAGYVRVSTFEQAEKGTSIDEQKRLIVEECQKRGWQLAKLYCDEGVSGKITDRPELQRLQADADAGEFQVIMFTKSDRLTRSLRDLNNLRHDWTTLGLEIYCIEQPEINSEGICGKLIRNLLGIFAEWERDAIVERTSSGRMARWRNYEAIIGALPYGYEYDKENHKIVFNKEKILVCRKIFNMYLSRGLSTRDIAIRLSKKSIPVPRSEGCSWQFATILKILKNPAYTGQAEYNQYKYIMKKDQYGRPYTTRSKEKKDKARWIKINFPPIISRAQHLRILDRMRSRTSLFSQKGEIYEKTFLLENILFYCGECGGKMRMRVTRRQRQSDPDRFYTYFIYRCSWNVASKKEVISRYRSQGRCDMRVDVSTLDDNVFAYVIGFFDKVVDNARDELMKMSVSTITEMINNWNTASSAEQISTSPNLNECIESDNWRVTKVSETELKYIRRCKDKYLRNSRITDKQRDVSKYKYNLVDELGEDLLKITGRCLITPENGNRIAKITNYIKGMPFDHKKRIIESIIAPEKGGKCVIKWGVNSTLSICTAHSSIKKRNVSIPARFRIDPLVVEITFYASLQRIIRLVWGGQGNGLFNLDNTK